MKFNTWKDAAKFCEDTFGTYVDWDEGFFLCPECGEPVYKCDWEDYAYWGGCPICDLAWEDME